MKKSTKKKLKIAAVTGGGILAATAAYFGIRKILKKKKSNGIKIKVKSVRKKSKRKKR